MLLDRVILAGVSTPLFNSNDGQLYMARANGHSNSSYTPPCQVAGYRFQYTLQRMLLRKESLQVGGFGESVELPLRCQCRDWRTVKAKAAKVDQNLVGLAAARYELFSATTGSGSGVLTFFSLQLPPKESWLVQGHRVTFLEFRQSTQTTNLILKRATGVKNGKLRKLQTR